MSDLSASDVLAMTKEDGMFGNSSWVIIFLFFLLFGFGGFGNNSALQNSLTRAELYDGLNTQDVKREIEDTQMQICNGFGGVNMNIMNNANAIQSSMCNGFNSVNQNLNQLGFNMQQCCCDLKTSLGDKIDGVAALIQGNTIQELRDRLADKDRELLTTGLVTAQTIQTNNLENYMRNLISGCGCNS